MSFSKWTEIFAGYFVIKYNFLKIFDKNVRKYCAECKCFVTPRVKKFSSSKINCFWILTKPTTEEPINEDDLVHEGTEQVTYLSRFFNYESISSNLSQIVVVTSVLKRDWDPKSGSENPDPDRDWHFHLRRNRDLIGIPSVFTLSVGENYN